MTTNQHRTYVFVICKCGKPLMPTTPPKARILLKQGKAKPFRLNPFTIKLTYETPHNVQPVEIRIDYGAKMHGIALVQQCKTQDKAVILAEARQRQDIKKKLDIRRELRRARRYRNTRYRKPRFNNRRRPEGWTTPTITQRIQTILRITMTLSKLTPITSAIAETSMFDTQRIVDPGIRGHQYEKGPGYDFQNRRHAVMAYFSYTCQYCGTKKGTMTEEHVIPKSKGGTDSWSNLTCACKECNDKKANRSPDEAGMPTPRTVNLTNASFLKYCALTQSGQKRLTQELQKAMPTRTVYGWQTKQNREAAQLPKAHRYDALCTSSVTEKTVRLTSTQYEIRARRRNTRQTNYMNPVKGGNRPRYNANKKLGAYKKGDLIETQHGLAYVTAILTSGNLKYETIHGQTSCIIPRKAELVESRRGIQFLTARKSIQKTSNNTIETNPA